MMHIRTMLASSIEACAFGSDGSCPIGIHIDGEGSARKLRIANNWFSNLSSTGTAIEITEPGAGITENIYIGPSHFATTTPVELGDAGGAASIFTDGTISVGAANADFSRLRVTSGSLVNPSYGFSSETSLGIYKSGDSTFAVSYGTFNMSQGRLMLRSLGDVLGDQSQGVPREIYFTDDGSTGTFCVRSGNTTYYLATSTVTDQ
jgi:hypothetical protein